MRKIQTLILAVSLMVSFTGFANVKVYDTGPPVTDYTIVTDVSIDPFIVYEVSPVPGIVQDINLAAPDVGPMADYTVYEKGEQGMILQATPNKSAAFIDRHRRTGANATDVNYTEDASVTYNSTAFADRHRLSYTG